MPTISNTALESLALTPDQKPTKKNELGQDEFLKLMLTQLRFQDPFKPMENGEFIAQMAQFSTVSGIDEMQKSMEALSTSLISNQALQASNLVGRNVLAPSNTATLNETGTVEGAFELPASASQITMSVFDESGNLIRTADLGTKPAGQHNFSWDGQTNEDSRAAAGKYTIKIEYGSGENAAAAEVLIQNKIASVNFAASGGQISLTTVDGQSLKFSDIRQIQ
ncbi:MAG TPA: flagellar hook assembly protein FlgD [Chromatiales bacterium]|nr:flagellar hook assembly protein FlgD [Thiotrichales bacterium]HIP67622.1 flagellar hook assembly protein FlgD [Chromatiales bacterium]